MTHKLKAYQFRPVWYFANFSRKCCHFEWFRFGDFRIQRKGPRRKLLALSFSSLILTVLIYLKSKIYRNQQIPKIIWTNFSGSLIYLYDTNYILKTVPEFLTFDDLEWPLNSLSWRSVITSFNLTYIFMNF